MLNTQTNFYGVKVMLCVAGLMLLLLLFGECIPERTLLLFTAIGTISLAILSFMQFKSSRDDNKRNYELARKSSEAQLRAYISVEIGKAELNFGEGANWQHDITKMIIPPEITIRNHGQTPAYKVTYWMKVGNRNVDFKEPISEQWNNNAPFTLHPSALIIPSKLKTSFNRDGFKDDGNEGNLSVFCWGGVKYSDAFKVERHTHFRLRFRYERIGELIDPLYCEEGNDAT